MARRDDRRQRSAQPTGGPEDPQAGMYSHGNYAAPWQDGRKPRSQRTGREVAQSSAQRDYADDIDSVPVLSESMVGGLWDHDQERAMGPRQGQPRPQRHDAEAMEAHWLAHGHKWTERQTDVFDAFWTRRLSYAEVGREIGTSGKQVYETIKQLRRDMHGAKRHANQRQGV